MHLHFLVAVHKEAFDLTVEYAIKLFRWNVIHNIYAFFILMLFIWQALNAFFEWWNLSIMEVHGAQIGFCVWSIVSLLWYWTLYNFIRSFLRSNHEKYFFKVSRTLLTALLHFNKNREPIAIWFTTRNDTFYAIPHLPFASKNLKKIDSFVCLSSFQVSYFPIFYFYLLNLFWSVCLLVLIAFSFFYGWCADW